MSLNTPSITCYVVLGINGIDLRGCYFLNINIINARHYIRYFV